MGTFLWRKLADPTLRDLGHRRPREHVPPGRMGLEGHSAKPLTRTLQSIMVMKKKESPRNRPKRGAYGDMTLSVVWCPGWGPGAKEGPGGKLGKHVEPISWALLLQLVLSHS